jgi:hypothetical protein
MNKSENPYETFRDAPSGLRSPLPATEFAPWLVTTSFIALPIGGGVLGFAGYIAACILLEVQPTETEPVLSHGQQAIFISLPISTLIGVGIGISLAFCFVCHRVISATLLLAVAAIGYSITRALWNAQIAEYGRDPSEAVLYHPLAAMCAFAVLVAIATVVYPTIRRRG